MPSVMLLVPIAIAVLGTWVFGLVICAPIPWLLLHVLGLRGWLTAVGLGAIETFVVVLGLSTHGFGLLLGSGKFSAGDANGQTVVDNVLTPYGWQRASESAALLAVAGAVVGFVVWRTAYRRNLTSQET